MINYSLQGRCTTSVRFCRDRIVSGAPHHGSIVTIRMRSGKNHHHYR